MTDLVLVSDAAAVMRATGILRSFIADNDAQLNAWAEVADVDLDTLMRTFSALVGIAALLTTLARDDYGDVDQTLYAIQRQLMRGDVPPPNESEK